MDAKKKPATKKPAKKASKDTAFAPKVKSTKKNGIGKYA
jgi:hypothetical protein